MRAASESIFGLNSAIIWAASGLISNGMLKAALFLLVGIIVFRLGLVDQETMLGRGTGLLGTGLMFAIGGLGLAELPPFGTSVGKTLIEDVATRAGTLPAFKASSISRRCSRATEP